MINIYIASSLLNIKKVKELDFDSVNDISQGKFDILLRKKL